MVYNSPVFHLIAFGYRIPADTTGYFDLTILQSFTLNRSCLLSRSHGISLVFRTFWSCTIRSGFWLAREHTYRKKVL